MKDIELPPLSKFYHPEPRTMQWSDLELYAIKSYARAAVEADRAQRVPDGAISGALFDFAGFLTTLDVPVRFGSTEEAAPMFELLQEFAKKRGLSLDNADVLHWSTLLASTPAPAQQERKPMTDREADILTEQHYFLGGRMPADYRISVVRATERHHGIKE